jgi:hypothetical protein
VIRRVVRLTFRMHRFEVAAVVVLGGLLTLCAIIVSWALGNLALPSDCVPSFETGEFPPSCLAKYHTFQVIGTLASPITFFMSIFSVIGGMLLGGPILAREIERGTTAFAWSMSPSRVRWFLQRVVPMLVVLLVVSFIVGAAADLLFGALTPDSHLSSSFVGFRLRGMLVATQAFLLASTAIAIGALLGRTVPTFLLSLILGGVSIFALAELHERALFAEAVVRSDTDNIGYSQDDLYLDSRFLLPDGTLVTYDELAAIDPTVYEFGPNYPSASLIIPGERYRTVEWREGAAQLAVGFVFLIGGAFIVTRRRPT